MKERPILFTGEMVSAVLEGRKTQTRRPMKRQPLTGSKLWLIGKQEGEDRAIFWCRGQRSDYGTPSPFQTGDRLWVRETWQAWRMTNLEYAEWDVCDCAPSEILGRYGKPKLEYAATSDSVGSWRPSIHMPRWASRITLEITAVRVERVQEITEEDAKAEGVAPTTSDWIGEGHAKACFSDLWQSIYGTWDANPWVWVYEFRRVKP